VDKNLENLYLRITPSRFHYLKFILEAYDNLAVLSSENGKAGIVRVRFPSELRADVYAILNEIAPKITPWEKA